MIMIFFESPNKKDKLRKKWHQTRHTYITIITTNFALNRIIISIWFISIEIWACARTVRKIN
jgi:hypothetical protein